ncbi:hypothetical protein KI387_020516, partial [Taxus chinensis]
SPDGQHLSFSIRFDQEDNTISKLSLWVADVETGQAGPLTGTSEFNINAVFDNFEWIDDSTLVVCTIPSSRGEPPKKPLIPSGPKIQSNEGENVVQVKTYQDLLKDEYDTDLFDYYATSQLLWVKLDGTMKPIGTPAVYTSIDPSPDGKYLMVFTIHRPYSFIVPCGRFPERIEIWTSDGIFVREICNLPLAEDIPIAFNSVRKGIRSLCWRPDKPSSLFWAETQDGGDAKMDVSPRDIIYTQPAEPLPGKEPEVLHKLDLRYRGISWSDDSLALVYESWYKTRRTRTWIISPANKEQGAHILFDISSDDDYSDPGSPMLRRTSTGTYVLAKIRKTDGSTYLLLDGSGATPEGDVPFLDLLNIITGEKERIWESEKETYYQEVVALMSDQCDGDMDLDKLKILFSKESKTENPQYFLQTWPDKRVSQITNFPHPYPQLSKLQKEMIRYDRKDGVQLTATLYLPPGYDASKDGPLPMLMWSHPGEFKSKDAAGQAFQPLTARFTSIGIIVGFGSCGNGEDNIYYIFLFDLLPLIYISMARRGRGGYAHMNRHMQELQRQVVELTGEVTHLRQRHTNGDADLDNDTEELPPLWNEGGNEEENERDEETLQERSFKERLIQDLEEMNDEIKINVPDYGGGL